MVKQIDEIRVQEFRLVDGWNGWLQEPFGGYVPAMHSEMHKRKDTDQNFCTRVSILNTTQSGKQGKI